MNQDVSKNVVLLFILFLILTAPPSSCFSSPQEDKVLVFATGEWPPYSSHDLEESGLFSRVVSEVFAREGYKVRFVFFPWKRCITLTKAGLFVGTFPWQGTPSREKDFLISDPVVFTETVFFHRTDFNFHWENLADLKNLHLGTTRGYAYMVNFRPKLRQLSINYSESDTDLINLRLLLMGHIDLFPLEKDVGNYLLSENFPTDRNRLMYHPKPLARVAQTILFPKELPNSKHLRAIFNNRLQQLRLNGQLEKISNIRSSNRQLQSIAKDTQGLE